MTYHEVDRFLNLDHHSDFEFFTSSNNDNFLYDSPTSMSYQQPSAFGYAKEYQKESPDTSSKIVYDFCSMVESPGPHGSTDCSLESEKSTLTLMSPGQDLTPFDANFGDSQETEPESPSEEESCKGCKKTKGKKPKKTQKKTEKSQNKMKNFPGLIMQRVKTSITEGNAYGKELEVAYGKPVIEELKTFLQGYQKQWKTWTSIQNFLSPDPFNGRALIDIIVDFLGDQSAVFFNEWVDGGKMNEKNKATLKENKPFFTNKFSEMAGELVDVTIDVPHEGFDDSEESYEPPVVKKFKAR